MNAKTIRNLLFVACVLIAVFGFKATEGTEFSSLMVGLWFVLFCLAIITAIVIALGKE